MLPFPADKIRCFEVFNRYAVHPARNAAPFTADSDEYRQNANATLLIATEFNARTQQRAGAFVHPHYIGSGLFDVGTTQFSCHVDDAPLVHAILTGMHTDGLLSSPREMPFTDSRSYLYSTATFTPH